MKRFFGMMPSDEIEKEVRFRDAYGITSTVQAGPHGWTILYGDMSSEYRDVVATTEENYAAAVAVLKNKLGTVVEVPDEGGEEEC